MVAGKPGYVWTGTEWAPISGNPVEGADLGVTDHPALTGRSNVDQHPITAVTGLQPALDGKSPTTHTHPSLDLQAGEGIALSDGSPNVISNTDLGTTATAAHEANATAHAQTLSPLVHSHDYADPAHTHTGYAAATHVHDGVYDPYGTAATLDLNHVNAPDPHSVYLAPVDVNSGDGIGVVTNPDGTITVNNLAKGGQPLVAAALNASGGQAIPNGLVWTTITNLILVDENFGNMIPDPPDSSFVIQEQGIYNVTLSVGTLINSEPNTQRGCRILRNGSALEGSTSRVVAVTDTAANWITTDQWEFFPGDIITFQVLQGTSAATLNTHPGSTRASISKVNGAVNQKVIGVGLGQTITRNIPDSAWRAIQMDKVIINTIEAVLGTDTTTATFAVGANGNEGWYDVVGSVAFSPSAAGNVRQVKLLVNDLDVPLVPVGSQVVGGSDTFPSGRNVYVQIAGPVYLKPNDKVSLAAYQNSGATITTQIDNTTLSCLFRGLDESQAAV